MLVPSVLEFPTVRLYAAILMKFILHYYLQLQEIYNLAYPSFFPDSWNDPLGNFCI